jgi:hypothetical protein
VGEKLTFHQKRGLEWFASQSAPVGLFPKGAPRHGVRMKLEAKGLIERLPYREMHFIQFQITDAGRTALRIGGEK